MDTSHYSPLLPDCEWSCTEGCTWVTALGIKISLMAAGPRGGSGPPPSVSLPFMAAQNHDLDGQSGSSQPGYLGDSMPQKKDFFYPHFSGQSGGGGGPVPLHTRTSNPRLLTPKELIVRGRLERVIILEPRVLHFIQNNIRWRRITPLVFAPNGSELVLIPQNHSPPLKATQRSVLQTDNHIAKTL